MINLQSVSLDGSDIQLSIVDQQQLTPLPFSSKASFRLGNFGGALHDDMSDAQDRENNTVEVEEMDSCGADSSREETDQA